LERNLDLVDALGVPRGPLPDSGLTLPVRGREDAERITRTLPDPHRFALLSPSVSVRQAYKRPPVELFAAAVARLNERGLRTLVVWGPGEEEDAKRAVSAAGGTAILAPPTSLPVLAALIERATMFLAGDTGPMHLACALRCPVLAIYGPTDPLVNGPWGTPFRAVFPPGRLYTGIKSNDRKSGFEGLGEEHIGAAVGELLAETATPD
jgi:ADP-heptose:LPS heptosyltransferase